MWTKRLKKTNLLLFSAETRTKELKKSTTERRDVFRWKYRREGSRKRRRNYQIEEGTTGRSLRAIECMQRFFFFVSNKTVVRLYGNGSSALFREVNAIGVRFYRSASVSPNPD